MRVVIQRAGHASVTIDGTCKSAIGKGLLILVGIEETDGQEDIDWLCKNCQSACLRRRKRSYEQIDPRH